MIRPVFYQRPTAARHALNVTPALASWDRIGSPGQKRATAFIDDAYFVPEQQIRITPDPLALRLDIGLPKTVTPDEVNDLDNYLYPLVPTLSRRSGREFASAWATKRHAETSSVTVERTAPATDPRGTYSFEVTTTASSSTSGYKRQVCDQLSTANPLRGRAVALHLAFVVGPRRAWPNLWKPTLDALGAILGHDPGANAWNPRDGRVIDLGLHCVTDPAAGNAVTIAIRASAVHD